MNILKRIRRWFYIRRGMFIRCERKNSAIFPSRTLFELIQKDHPEDKEFYFLFSKDAVYITIPDGRRVQRGVKNYVFFVNPDWKRHGIDNPMRVMTQQLVAVDGRIGLHAYQPTVEEIATMYGINEDRFDLYIERSELNGEPYYIIKRP